MRRANSHRRATLRLAVASALLAALIAIPTIAHADDAPCASRMTPAGAKRAMPIAVQAKQALSAGHNDEALKLYQRAWCLYPKPTLCHGLSKAEFYLGRCSDALAHAHIWAEHPGADEREKAQGWLTAVEAGCVSVAIRTDPPGASIRVDGSPIALGTTPWTGALHAGAHHLILSRTGFDDLRPEITVPWGRRSAPLEESFTMQRAPPVFVELPPIPEAEPPVAAAPPAPPPAAPAPATPSVAEPAAPPAATAPVTSQPAAASTPAAPAAVTTQRAPASPPPVPTAVVTGHPAKLRLRWEPLIPASAALVGLAIGIAGGVLSTQCPVTAVTVVDAYADQRCQFNRAGLADIGWGLAGAGAATAAILWLVLKPGPLSPAPHPAVLEASFLGNGLQVKGRF
jgi:hypothetical protein